MEEKAEALEAVTTAAAAALEAAADEQDTQPVDVDQRTVNASVLLGVGQRSVPRVFLF